MSYEAAKALLEKSVSRPTLYRITLPENIGINLGPQNQSTGTGVSRDVSEYMSFFANKVTLPETRLDTVIALGQEYMGIAREQPANMVYGKPMTMTVIENSDFTTFQALRDWMKRTTFGSDQTRVSTQRMNYYDTFVGNIVITKLEQPDNTDGDDIKYKEPLKWTFNNAYPVVVGDIALASDAQNSATTFDVSFTYESYSVSTEDEYLKSVR